MTQRKKRKTPEAACAAASSSQPEQSDDTLLEEPGSSGPTGKVTAKDRDPDFPYDDDYNPQATADGHPEYRTALEDYAYWKGIANGMRMAAGGPPREELTETVPVRHRLDGWTPEKQRLFLETLAETGNVSLACRLVKMSRTSAYMLKQHPEAEAFSCAWEGAKMMAEDALVDEALDRVREGVVIEKTNENGETTEIRKPDGATLRFLIKRKDRLERSEAIRDRPQQRSARNFFALLDIVDPVETDGAVEEDEPGDARFETKSWDGPLQGGKRSFSKNCKLPDFPLPPSGSGLTPESGPGGRSRNRFRANPR